MSKIFTFLDALLTKIFLVLIRIYQKTISPDEGVFKYRLRGKVCAHEPHCSEYARLSLHRYGFIDSIEDIITRVTSCRPSMTKNYDPVSYRVVFASSAPIGVPFLQALADDPRFDLIGVVTQPDQPVGRGLKMTANIIKTQAQQLGLADDDIQTPNSLRLTSRKYADEATSFATRLKDKQPNFLVVIAYGNIIPQHILDIPTIGPINVHGSLLPHYRGASPIQSVLLDDQSKTGITIMHMDAGLDTGPILSKISFPLTIHTTARDIIAKFQEIGPQLLINTMIDYAKGHISEISQDNNQATHCSKLEKSHGLINPWTQSLAEINNIYRACILWPKTYFILDESWGRHTGKQIIIDTLTLDEHRREAHKTQPLINKKELNPAVTTLLIKPEGSKAMTWEDRLRGI